MLLQPAFAIEADEPVLKNRTWVDRFYELKGDQLFWFKPGEQAAQLRKTLGNIIDSAGYKALNKEVYSLPYAPAGTYTDQVRADRVYTDNAIAYFLDLYQGYDIKRQFSFDELSPACDNYDKDLILTRLASVKSARDLYELEYYIEPAAAEYVSVRDELHKQIDANDTAKIKQLNTALNIYRYIWHFNYEKFIVVNIGSAYLKYYESDSLKTSMKIVAGKPRTPTPRFAAHCDQVIFYPYWHVPRSIAVNEILPACKKNPAVIQALNLQVLDNKGRIVAPHTIKWSAYNKKNFPYSFRQSTGCDNALGVIKFNLTSPYSVYIHDTNLKSAFGSASRYYSHGCIRIEKPVELATYLLENKVDKAFLESCRKGQQPVVKPLHTKVPVFVIYTTADTDTSGQIQYHKDIYNLTK